MLFFLLVLAGFVVVVVQLARKYGVMFVQKKLPPQPSECKSLNLSSIEVPPTKGFILVVLRWLIQMPGLGSLICWKLQRDASIGSMWDFNFLDFPGTMWSSRMTHPVREDVSPFVPRETLFEGFRAPTINDYVEAYKNGTSSPVKVAQRIVDIVSNDRDPTNSIVQLMMFDVLKQARESEKRLKDGKALSQWDGVPIAIKDELDVKGYPTMSGTVFVNEKQPATEDGHVVSLFRKLGFLIIGKATMMEIGIHPFGFNGHYGSVKNPHNVKYDSGGSSSGSAAAVANGLVPLAIGADGGGSIRVPASFCGVVGLKANIGRISEHGAFPLCYSVGHVGPLASCVRDISIAYDIIGKAAPHDAATMHQPATHSSISQVFSQADNEQPLQGVRVGVWDEWVNYADSDDVKKAFRDTLSEYERLGAEIVPFVIPCMLQIRAAHLVTILSEMDSTMQYYTTQLARMQPATHIPLLLAGSISGAQYSQAQKIRTFAISELSKVFETCDVIATPTTGICAPPMHTDGEVLGIFHTKWLAQTMLYMFIGNLLGNPGISVPIGYSRYNMPIGLQLMSRPFCEHDIFYVAEVTERLTKRRKPEVFHDILE